MSDLGDLLELLHGAHPFETLHARFRTWRNHERLHAAFVAHADRSGATMYGPSGAREAPLESEEIVHIWRAADRARVAHEGGERDRYYRVRVGDRWWMWTRGAGR